MSMGTLLSNKARICLYVFGHSTFIIFLNFFYLKPLNTPSRLPHSNLTPDVRLYTGVIKRPGVSFGIRRRALPTPPPASLILLPNGEPTSDENLEGQSDSGLNNLEYEPYDLRAPSRIRSDVNKDSITQYRTRYLCQDQMQIMLLYSGIENPISKIFKRSQPILNLFSFSLRE